MIPKHILWLERSEHFNLSSTKQVLDYHMTLFKDASLLLYRQPCLTTAFSLIPLKQIKKNPKKRKAKYCQMLKSSIRFDLPHKTGLPSKALYTINSYHLQNKEQCFKKNVTPLQNFKITTRKHENIFQFLFPPPPLHSLFQRTKACTTTYISSNGVNEFSCIWKAISDSFSRQVRQSLNRLLLNLVRAPI